MSKPTTLLILLLVGIFGACHLKTPKTELDPETLSKTAQDESDPRKVASLRLTEKGKKEYDSFRYERAANQLSRAIEIDPDNAFAYFYLGLARQRVARFSEAKELFGRSAELFVEQNDWKAEALARKAESLENLKKVAEAKKYYDQALDVDPGNRRAREGLQRAEEGR